MSSTRLYVLADWFASGLGFLIMTTIYRKSSDLTSLGVNGWTLTLLSASLFISGAAQYYTMIKGSGLFRTYVLFLPYVVVESLFLYTLIDSYHYLYLVGIIFLNVFFAIYRGNLMASSRLLASALWNVAEQLLRFLLITAFIYVLALPIIDSLLLGTFVTYAIFTLITLTLTTDLVDRAKKKQKGLSASSLSFSEPLWFVLLNLGIYFAVSMDILLLKNFPDLKGQVVLLKPWGQILQIASTPFINIYLTNLRERANSTLLIKSYVTFVLGYFLVLLFFVDPLSSLLFNKTVSSHLILYFILIEHLGLSLLVTYLYRLLNTKINL